MDYHLNLRISVLEQLENDWWGVSLLPTHMGECALDMRHQEGALNHLKVQMWCHDHCSGAFALGLSGVAFKLLDDAVMFKPAAAGGDRSEG